MVTLERAIFVSALLLLGATARAGVEADRAIVESKVAFHVQAKDYSAAAQALSQHLERDPSFERGWNLLGLVRYRAKDSDGAAEAFRKAAETAEKSGSPEYPVYYYNLADTNARAGKNDEARQTIEQVLTKRTAYDGSFRSALRSLAAGKPLPALDRPGAVRQRPGSAPGAWLTLGVRPGYDSNVLLAPDLPASVAAATTQASPLLGVRSAGGGNWLGWRGVMSTAANFAYTRHLEEGVSTYDSIGGAAAASWSREMPEGAGLSYGFGPGAGFAFLNSSGFRLYYWDVDLLPRLTWHLDADRELTLEGPTRYQAFPDGSGADDRTGFGTGGRLTFSWPAGPNSFAFGLTFDRLFASGANFRASTFGSALRWERQLSRRWRTSAGIALQRIIFGDHSLRRADTLFDGSAALELALGARAAIELGYGFTKNYSNVSSFAYDRHSIAMMVSYDLI